MAAHAFNPSTETEVEAEGPLSLRPVLYAQKAPGRARLHKETLSQKTNKWQQKTHLQYLENENLPLFSQIWFNQLNSNYIV